MPRSRLQPAPLAVAWATWASDRGRRAPASDRDAGFPRDRAVHRGRSCARCQARRRHGRAAANARCGWLLLGGDDGRSLAPWTNLRRSASPRDCRVRFQPCSTGNSFRAAGWRGAVDWGDLSGAVRAYPAPGCNSQMLDCWLRFGRCVVALAAGIMGRFRACHRRRLGL